MQQIDLELSCAAFLNDRVDLQVLALGEFINVVDNLVVLVDSARL